MITCNECGCPYSKSLPYCPECGNPTNTRFVNQTVLTNCPNCGSPVTNNTACEYCESAFPTTVKSPEKVIINNNNNGSDNSAMGVGAAAFLGGILGGILGD